MPKRTHPTNKGNEYEPIKGRVRQVMIFPSWRQKALHVSMDGAAGIQIQSSAEGCLDEYLKELVSKSV